MHMHATFSSFLNWLLHLSGLCFLTSARVSPPLPRNGRISKTEFMVLVKDWHYDVEEGEGYWEDARCHIFAH